MGLGGVSVVPESQFCLCPVHQCEKLRKLPKTTRECSGNNQASKLFLYAEMADSVGMGLSQG